MTDSEGNIHRDGVNSQKGSDMTEMVNGEGQNISSSAGIPVTPSQTPQAPVEERTFRQSEVNDMIGRARAETRAETVERLRRESNMQPHNQNYANSPSQIMQQPAPYNPSGYGQQPFQQQPQGLTEDQVRKLAAEESRRSREELILEQRRTAEQQNAQRIASEFFNKVGTGDGGVEGFYKRVNEAGIDIQSIPYHVQLANQVDNTREVMEDLISNPIKIGQIQNLINIDLEAQRAGRNSNLAYSEIKRLSDSIKLNQNAGRYQSPNEPLSQLRPSNTGMGNQGVRAPGDYKRDPRYRI